MKNLILLILIPMIFIIVYSCDENSTDPNSLGGETDIELTEEGSEFGIYISMDGAPGGLFDQIEDSCYITESNDGIIKLHGLFTTNEGVLKSVDTLLGTEDAPENIKHIVVDALLDRYGATLDTTDKQNITLEFDLIGKVTSEGIQDFIYSKGDISRPFTLIKYNAKVGDKYSFTMDDGTKITREVVYKSSDDEYELGFMYIKVIKVEETQPDDPLIDKLIYNTNHKFGLVGIEMKMKNGKTANFKVFPWNVLN